MNKIADAVEHDQALRGTSPGAGPAMVLRDARFGYEPGRPVVDGVSVELTAGRVCCLIGPNAAGKSTLLKMMLGQLEPWSGEVTIAGQPIARMKPRQRAKWISYVPQRGGVSFAFTVRQVLEMGRYAAGDESGAVDEAISLCELGPVADRVFAHLSGGQQQQVLIARAIAQSRGQGRVMLLDEPASSLDLWHVHQLMRLLRAQAARGLAVLVVLHDLNLTARYADEVWLMDEGRLRAAGRWDAVLQPAVLEPVYRVGLRWMRDETAGRPVFHVEPADRMEGTAGMP